MSLDVVSAVRPLYNVAGQVVAKAGQAVSNVVEKAPAITPHEV